METPVSCISPITTVGDTAQLKIMSAETMRTRILPHRLRLPFTGALLYMENLLQHTVRHVYNEERVGACIVELTTGIESGLYSQEQYEIIAEVLRIVKKQMQELGSIPGQWGIVHADVQPENVIITETGPCLIDFGFCGYGYYLFDLGSAATVFPGGLRKRFLEGYASAADFSLEQIRYIEGQIFMDTFISYLFFIGDSNRNGRVKESAAKLCDTLCKDFIAGKEVFYSF